MKKFLILNGSTLVFLLVMSLLVFTGCASRQMVTNCVSGHVYGFWGGLWHGVIAPIDLICMLFRDDVSVFATNNNGAWYALGFVIGSGGWGFLGGHKASRAQRRKRI